MGIIDQAIQAQKSFPDYCHSIEKRVREQIRTEFAPYVTKGVVEIDYNPSGDNIALLSIVTRKKKLFQTETTVLLHCYFRLSATMGDTEAQHKHRIEVGVSRKNTKESYIEFSSMETGLAEIGRRIDDLKWLW